MTTIAEDSIISQLFILWLEPYSPLPIAEISEEFETKPLKILRPPESYFSLIVHLVLDNSPSALKYPLAIAKCLQYYVKLLCLYDPLHVPLHLPENHFYFHRVHFIQ